PPHALPELPPRAHAYRASAAPSSHTAALSPDRSGPAWPALPASLADSPTHSVHASTRLLVYPRPVRRLTPSVSAPPRAQSRSESPAPDTEMSALRGVSPRPLRFASPILQVAPQEDAATAPFVQNARLQF